MAMLDLQCEKCNYKFSLKALPKKCPYCDKAGGVKKAQTAQDLLDETIGEFSQFEESQKKRQK